MLELIDATGLCEVAVYTQADAGVDAMSYWRKQGLEALPAAASLAERMHAWRPSSCVIYDKAVPMLRWANSPLLPEGNIAQGSGQAAVNDGCDAGDAASETDLLAARSQHRAAPRPRSDQVGAGWQRRRTEHMGPKGNLADDRE